jgi:hypothetical protein
MKETIMYRVILAAAVAVGLPFGAFAQSVSNDMTCEEAKAYFAENKMIDTRNGEQVVPVSEGVPEAEQGSLDCSSSGGIMPVFVVTSDDPQCAVAHKCK